MARALLVTVGCAIAALCLMLAGHYGANIMFPVTSDPPPPPTEAPVPVSELPTSMLVRLYVPFWAPIAHLAACAVAAFIGGFLAARLMPGAFWPVWVVASVLGVWELVAIADIPKSFSFSATAAAICIAGAWLGAVASHVASKRSAPLN